MNWGTFLNVGPGSHLSIGGHFEELTRSGCGYPYRDMSLSPPVGISDLSDMNNLPTDESEVRNIPNSLQLGLKGAMS
jgi:hypothetical protein